MKRSHLVLAALLVTAASTFAQTPSADHGSHHATAQAPATAAVNEAMTDGEVRKVDKEAGKVTLRHGPLANLGMPNMTMVFRVAEPKMLDGLEPGDKVRFLADKVDGAFTVTRIEVLK